MLWRHVLPQLADLDRSRCSAVHTSWVIGGTVVIETVFGMPGLGSLLVVVDLGPRLSDGAGA